MAYKIRTTGLRFSVGQSVLITDCINTVHTGEVGTIVGVESSRHSPTLDKYEVRFPSGIQKTFWDIQLRDPCSKIA